jgi:hypothetical protein
VFPDVSKKGITFMGLGHQEERRMTHQTEGEGTMVLLKRRETPDQRNSVACHIPTNYREISFSFVLLLLVRKRSVIVRYVVIAALQDKLLSANGLERCRY